MFTAKLTPAQSREVRAVLIEMAKPVAGEDSVSFFRRSQLWWAITLTDKGLLTVTDIDAVHPLAIAVEAATMRRDVKAHLTDKFGAMLVQVKTAREEAKALQDERDGGRYTLARAVSVAYDYHARLTATDVCHIGEAEDAADALMVDSGEYSVWPDMRVVHDDRWHGYFASALDAHRVEREVETRLAASTAAPAVAPVAAKTLDVGDQFRVKPDGDVFVVRNGSFGYVQYVTVAGTMQPYWEVPGSTLVYPVAA